MTRPERTIHRALASFGLCVVSVATLLVATPRAGAISAEGCRGGAAPFEILDTSDESGIGGTGLTSDPSPPPQATARMTAEPQPTTARPEDGSESGIGGTGRSPGSASDDDESGVGGTGIFGPITAKRLDRVCVNGLEIGIPKRLSIQSANGTTSDDRTADQNLEVGTVVWIEATSTEAGLVAERIEIAPTLSGRIGALRRDGRDLIVAGQPVRLPDAALPGPIPGAEGLQPGDRIRVHGLRNPAGEWVASRIEPAGKERADQTDPSDGNPTRAMPVSIAEWLAQRPHPRFLSIEGYVDTPRDAPGALRLQGLSLAFGSDLPRGTRERLRPGARVRATGRLTPEGGLQIERLPRSFRPLHSESSAPPHPSTQDPESKRSVPSEKVPPRPRPPRSDDIDRSWQEIPKRPERPPHRIRPIRRPPRPPIDRQHR